MRSLLRQTHARFKRARLAYGHGTTNAWDEAVYLVLHALRLPLDQLTPVLERPLTAVEQRRAEKLIGARIARRIPAAYLTREAWLGNLRFYVDERVIVPRSFIAELLRERLRPWLPPRARVARALDLGTGSACLAILMAATFPKARIVATDVDRNALAVARRNVAAYGLEQRITLERSDMFASLQGERFDLIVSNPPYVGAGIMRTLPPEYRHEPRLALASGLDGFDAVRTILREAARHLTTKGLLVVEVGHNRKRLEATFPHLPFVWPHTQGGDCVFILACDALDAHERQAAPPPAAARRRARPQAAASRRR